MFLGSCGHGCLCYPFISLLCQQCTGVLFACHPAYEVMRTDAKSAAAMCSSYIKYCPYAGAAIAEPVCCNISAIPEVVVNGHGQYNDISGPWPV